MLFAHYKIVDQYKRYATFKDTSCTHEDISFYSRKEEKNCSYLSILIASKVFRFGYKPMP